MIGAIRKFFEKNIKPSSHNQEALSERSLQMATSALLIEMMRADAEITEDEKAAIAEIMRSRFALSEQETCELIRLAGSAIEQATGYFEFTSLINKGFSYEEKVKVIEHLWEVAFSDASLDKYEEHMVRKIAGLIYVSHSDFINAKLRVKKRLSC